jgi:hypothetical protein
VDDPEDQVATTRAVSVTENRDSKAADTISPTKIPISDENTLMRSRLILTVPPRSW